MIFSQLVSAMLPHFVLVGRILTLHGSSKKWYSIPWHKSLPLIGPIGRMGDSDSEEDFDMNSGLPGVSHLYRTFTS